MALYEAAAHLIYFPEIAQEPWEAAESILEPEPTEAHPDESEDSLSSELDAEVELFLNGKTGESNPEPEDPAPSLFDGIPGLEAFGQAGTVIKSSVEPKIGAAGPGKPTPTQLTSSQVSQKHSGALVATEEPLITAPSVSAKVVVAQLEQLLAFYVQNKDFGRVLAYRRAIGEVLSWRQPVTAALLETHSGRIGPKIKEKILETLQTGQMTKLTRIEHVFAEDGAVLKDFANIWGIGEKQAAKLHAAGFRSIQDLRDRPDSLNRAQRVGLKYYEEFLLKVSREEVGVILKTIETTLAEAFPQEWPSYRMVCCGSYRRGRPACGDVDILLWRVDGGAYQHFLGEVIKTLYGKGILKETLSHSHELTSKGTITYMGVCTLGDGKPHRRIDIKVAPAYPDLPQSNNRLCDAVFHRVGAVQPQCETADAQEGVLDE